jgi:hypothetical protein
MAWWADLWQAPSCMELCLSGLAEIKDLQADDVNAMLEGLPEPAQSSPSFTKVKASTQTGQVFYSVDKQQLASSS